MSDPEDKNLSAVQWVRTQGSGTLNQAINCEMAWKEHYLHERLAMEVASEARVVHRANLTTGRFISSPDDKVTTELGWYRRVFLDRWSRMGDAFNKATIEVVYFTLEEGGERSEGAGYLVSGLKLDWLPLQRVILITLALWDQKTKTWTHNNPL